MTQAMAESFNDGFRLIDGTDLNKKFAHPEWSVDESVTATSGGTVNNSYRVVCTITNITSATANASIVIEQALPGLILMVINNTANNIVVFADGDSTIGGVPGNVGYLLYANQSVYIVSSQVKVWEALPLAYSGQSLPQLSTLPNITALRGVAPGQVPVVFVQGYYAAGDGGGGEYVSATSGGPYTDNGGSIITQSGGVAASAWLLKRTNVFNVDQFGAVGDGLTNSTSAITNAEAAAYAAGGILYFPPKVYRFLNQFNCRVSIEGHGATLKQLATVWAPSGVNLVYLIRYDGVSNFYIKGLTFDSNLATTGALISNADNVLCEDVTMLNSRYLGLAIISSSNSRISNCVSKVCPLTNIPATAFYAGDPFYFQAVTNFEVVNCYAYDFGRIGFVVEGFVGGTVSNDILFTNCIAEYAHDSDGSATEFNAGFWTENSNNTQYVNCEALNISSGVNQTNKRVAGFVSSSGSSAPCSRSYVNCIVDKNTIRIPNGIISYGTLGQTYITWNITNFFVRGCLRAITSLGSTEAINIKNLTVEDHDGSLYPDGAIVFDQTPAPGPIPNVPKIINIDGMSVDNTVALEANTGDITFYYADILTVLNITNALAITVSCANPLAKITVDNSTVYYGQSINPSFSAAEIVFKGGFIGLPRAGTTNPQLFLSFGTGTNSVIFEAGARVSGDPAAPGLLFLGSLNGNFYFNATGAIFDAVWFQTDIDTAVPGFVSFENCLVTGITTGTTYPTGTPGFLFTTSIINPDLHVQVKNCKFTMPSVSYTPIQFYNSAPAQLLVAGNTYNTTLLYSGFPAAYVTDASVYYGSFYSTATQTIGTSATTYPVAFDTTVTAVDVSLVGGTQLTVNYPGVYQVDFTAAINTGPTGAPAAPLYFFLEKNGTSGIDGTSTPVYQPAANERIFFDTSYVYTLDAGESLGIRWQCLGTNGSYLEPRGLPTVAPSQPSARVTITKIR